MGRWIGILLAETGSSTDPGALHYDYIDVEMTASVIQAAKQTFWWEAFSYPGVSSTLGIYIRVLSLVPRQLIKIHLPLCQILNSWSVLALQHVRCVYDYRVGILLSSVKDADTIQLYSNLSSFFSVSLLIKCYILIFYFAWRLRTVSGRGQISWNMQLYSSRLSIGCTCCTYSQYVQHILASICCTLKMYSEFKSWIITFLVFPSQVLYD